MANKAPAYQMYAADFAMDTLGWPADCVGSHLRLMNYQWVNNAIPDDLDVIAAICGIENGTFARVWKFLEGKYPVGQDGKRRNGRLETERNKQNEFRQKQSKASAKRWESQAISQPTSQTDALRFSSSSSTSSLNQEQKLTPTARATRIPTDFKVTPDHRYFAVENDLPSPDDHIAEFRDYWIGKAGATAKKLDWDATFRNWLRRAKQYGPKALGGANGGTRASQRQKSSFDAIAAAVDRANQRARGGGNGSHEGSLHQPGPAGGNAGRDDAGLEGSDSGVRRKDVQASVIESQTTLQILPNHGRDKGVLRSGLERIPAPVGSG